MLEALLKDDKMAETLARSPPGWNKTEVTGDFVSVSRVCLIYKMSSSKTQPMFNNGVSQQILRNAKTC